MHPISLEVIRVKIPCTVPWDSMPGDDRVRFCGECQLHVHNVSALSEEEIAGLVQRTQGRLCVTYFQRPDGTIVIEKCPRALRPIRNGYRWVAARMAAWTGLVASIAGGCVMRIGGVPVCNPSSRKSHPTASQPAATYQIIISDDDPRRLTGTP